MGEEVQEHKKIEIFGKYKHQKNENLDEYFSAIGVPFFPRKIMAFTSPILEISVNDEEKWSIKTSTLIRTNESTFKLNEEYEEQMPGSILKSTTTRESDTKLVTVSIAPNGKKATRTYEFTENECILTYSSEDTDIVAKRYFIRIK